MLTSVTPSVFYRDPLTALKWLEAAFGFELTTLVTDEAGQVGHSEMRIGQSTISIGGEFASPELLGPATMKSPAALAGAGTQFIRVHVSEGIDAHCDRARAAGAKITQEPADQFYGARTYRALDPEGHVWTFHQEVSVPTVAEMEAASGLKFQVTRAATET